MVLPLVLACAVCGAAERALPANGDAVAFEGRKRAMLDARAAGFAETTGSGVRLTELRLEPGAAAAVTESLLVSGDVPILRRTIGAARPEVVLGDVELRASYALKHEVGTHLALDAGAKLPTAPIDPNVTPDLQPGCSSVVPFAGVTWFRSGALLSGALSATLLMPVSVKDAPHPGDSARASAMLQLQPTSLFATRLGVYARYDSTAELDGAALPRSGGGSVHVAPEIVLAPARDLVVSFGAAFPLVQAMRAYRATSPVLLASVGWDF